jgi:hypothetical protein
MDALPIAEHRPRHQVAGRDRADARLHGGVRGRLPRHAGGLAAGHHRERAVGKPHATNISLGGEWIETRLLSSGPRTNPWFR